MARNQSEKVQYPVKEINLKEIYEVIKRRVWIILLSTVLLGFMGGLYSSIPEVPLYGASARVMLSASSLESLGTLKVFIREPVILEQVIEELELNQSVGNLRSNIMVNSVDNSIITMVTVLDEDQRRAAIIANKVVEVFTQEAAEKLEFNGVEVLSNAMESPNPMPVNPSSNRALYFGIITGLLLGTGLVFLLDSLDETVRSSRDLERNLGIKPLGRITKARKRDMYSKEKARTKTKNEYIRGETVGS